MRLAVRSAGVALAAVAVLSTACSGDGAPTGPESIAQVAGRWPTGLDRLDPSTAAAASVHGVRAEVPGAAEVEVRSLARHGGAIARSLGSESLAGLPDVVFVSRRGGYGTIDGQAVRRQVLFGLLDPDGVGSLSTPHYDSLLDAAPFHTVEDVYGGYLPHANDGYPRLSGLMASVLDTAPGTWCAFVAHGVLVVVVGSTFTREQDEQLANSLRS